MVKKGSITKKIFFALGTVNTLTVREIQGDGTDPAVRILERAKARVLELHKKLSVFDENSEIARINRYAGEKPVKVSEDTFALIERAKRYSGASGGLFDITLSPVTRLWKRALKERRVPDGQDVNAALNLADSEGIITDHANVTVMLKDKGQQIELGSVAKGYAADEVRRIFREEGVNEGIIDLGGTVVNLGRVKKIGVQDPFAGRGKTFAVIDAGEEAVVTSGYYEQFFEQDGKIYHHIIDPRTGRPSETDIAGVTLVGRSAEVLDALTTSAFIAGAEEAVGLIKQFGVEGAFVLKDRRVLVTKGLKKRFSFG